MEKKAWVKPVTLVQKFEANEPCAAEPCWRVTCEWSGIGHFYCHDEGNYRFLDGDENGKVDRMQNKHASLWSDCEFYSDENFEHSLGKNLEEIDVEPGQVIYYNTEYGLGYHHKGTVYIDDLSHPNRS